MSSRTELLNASIQRSAAAITSLADQVATLDTLCDTVVGALSRGNKLLTLGHGGSAADALHMSEELVGRFDADRRPLPAVCLAADPTLMTCILNDYGFAEIFPRQIDALGQAGDVLVIFSTSGNGDGLERAARMASQKKMASIGLLGKGGGSVASMVDHALVVDSAETARIQEVHTLILHLILEAVDRQFV
ncbi:SIS domain-containing protein [Planctomycetales bacterium ZRK34]|nr:SIS domain-containing protein [Planctomycetales bacterium ZRK34]